MKVGKACGAMVRTNGKIQTLLLGFDARVKGRQ